MACVKHQKRIKDLEQALAAARKQASLNEASVELREDNAKLSEQNATLVEQLHSCKDCAERLGAAELRVAELEAEVEALKVDMADATEGGE